ncbi:MarR family transcriptional regulator [Streptomyces tateyamensis]|uniref:MarR family transcriptional regulator n=1 Tax=Streptomyces tateyamensis TaxID=565073 RepID=A0A2V4N3I4_9ACTN|nr:MarR family transcriptional regulator [Streptomyces tateyamensis]PYC77314.1 MarR family transcriptional regulator [Streptomyces tateyamensis]
MTEMPAAEHLCTRIRRAEKALMAHHEAVLRGFGLTMTQYTVLLRLSREDGLSGAELARGCGVSQQSMATVLSTLHGKGLITRTVSPAHAKVLVTELTEAGQVLVKRAHQEVAELETGLSRAFRPAEYAVLCELLERATSTLVRQTRHPAAR